MTIDLCKNLLNFVFAGSANNFGRNLSPNGAQNQDGLNSWASSGASAFASSSAGSKFSIGLFKHYSERCNYLM